MFASDGFAARRKAGLTILAGRPPRATSPRPSAASICPTGLYLGRSSGHSVCASASRSIRGSTPRALAGRALPAAGERQYGRTWERRRAPLPSYIPAPVRKQLRRGPVEIRSRHAAGSAIGAGGAVSTVREVTLPLSTIEVTASYSAGGVQPALRLHVPGDHLTVEA